MGLQQVVHGPLVVCGGIASVYDGHTDTIVVVPNLLVKNDVVCTVHAMSLGGCESVTCNACLFYLDCCCLHISSLQNAGSTAVGFAA